MKGIALTLTVLVLVLAPSAAADVRHASPAGTGSVCSEAAPCSLDTAVGSAVASDEIVVGLGTYTLGAALTPTVPLTIHGSPGVARPRISAPIGSPVLESQQTLHISDLTLESTNAGGYGATMTMLGGNSSAERIEAIAVSTADAATALRPGAGFLLRDSLLRAQGVDAGTAALFFQAVAASSTVTVRNVTALASASASADSTALGIFATAMGANSSIEATNVIADAGADAAAAGSSPATPAAIHLFNSNFDSSSGTVTGTGNQATPPAFVNAAAGDFRQAPGSPTIDAGVTDPANGALDLDGKARTANGTTDIGAYESQPTVPAAPADTSAPRTAIGVLRLSRSGIVSATLSCPSGETRCDWAYALRSAKRVATTSRRRRPKRRVVRLGGGTASAAGGRRVTIRVRLSAKNVRLIKRLRRLPVKLTVTTTDAAGNRATRTKTATLKAPKRASKRRRA